MKTLYPSGLIIVCVIIAVIIAYFSYFRKKDDAFTAYRKYVLAALRFFVVLIPALLLLSPYFYREHKIFSKPVAVIALDNSKSMLQSKDSLVLKSNFDQSLKNSVSALKNDYELRFMEFSDTVQQGLSGSFDGNETNYSLLRDYLDAYYPEQELEALILISDGIYTKGTQPLYEFENAKFPVYSIKVGDSTHYPDASIRQIISNEVLFKDRKTSVRVYYEANDFSPGEMILELYTNGKLQDKDTIYTEEGITAGYSELYFTPQETGFLEMEAVMVSGVREKNSINNHMIQGVEVLDARQKLLLLFDGPHPDIHALSESISRNDNYELQIENIKDFSSDIEDFNLIILYQLPNRSHSMTSLLGQVKKQNIPLLLFVGTMTSVDKLNALNIGLQIEAIDAEPDRIFPKSNPLFSLFIHDTTSSQSFSEWSALRVPFGKYKMSGDFEIMFYQQIDQLLTDKPMAAFTIKEDNKYAFICGEDIWKWRVKNYLYHQNYEIFDQFVNALVQYQGMSLKKKRFVVNVQSIVNENDKLMFYIQLYNRNFESITKPTVNLEIIDAQGNDYSFQAMKDNESYFLNAGSYPRGKYSWRAFVEVGNEQFEERGSFIVKAEEDEFLNTRADYFLLDQLSNESGGISYTLNELPKMLDYLTDNAPDMQQDIVEKKYFEWISLPWIFFIWILFVATEWFLRKYFGSL